MVSVKTVPDKEIMQRIIDVTYAVITEEGRKIQSLDAEPEGMYIAINLNDGTVAVMIYGQITPRHVITSAVKMAEMKPNEADISVA